VNRRSALHKAGSAAALAALVALPVFTASPALAYSSQEWQLNYLNATQAWTLSQGSGMTVAMIDTGCENIPDLNGQLLSGADFSGGATTSHGNGQDDESPDGHGTNMAVDVAGNGTNVEGLAPQAKILPVRVADSDGDFLPASLAAGIQYAISQHVQVINMALGAPTDWGTSVDTAIAQAEAANIVVVAASGNESSTSVDFPGATPGVVAVSATDQNGALWPQSNTGAQVALAAPGANIYADDADNQQGTSSGTSNSAAFVSAAAALVRSAHPSWTAGQVIRDLISTADPGSGQTAGQHSNQYGYGIVDPVKALQASAPSETSNPLLGSSASASASAASGAGASNSPAATASGSSSSSGLIIVIVIAALVVLGIGTLIVVMAKRRGGRGGGPKPPAGPGGGGYPQQNPNPYAQQQSPYQQQQNPYGQAQGHGGYPSPPQQQPPAPYGYGNGGNPPQQQPRPQPNPYGQQQQQPPQAPPGNYYGGGQR
jgi:subtilisin family serine protease